MPFTSISGGGARRANALEWLICSVKIQNWTVQWRPSTFYGRPSKKNGTFRPLSEAKLDFSQKHSLSVCERALVRVPRAAASAENLISRAVLVAAGPTKDQNDQWGGAHLPMGVRCPRPRTLWTLSDAKTFFT
jgi:hypothetical protein